MVLQESPIPTMVDVSIGGDKHDDDELKYSTGTGKPGVTAALHYPSPLGLFAGASRLFQDEDDTDTGTVASYVTHATIQSTRLGISRPSYGNDDASTKASTTSHRIGIVRPNYDTPAQLLSPLELFQQTTTPSAPNLVRSDTSESSSDNLWQLKSTRRDFVPDQLPPPEEEEQPTDNVDRFVHKQTSEGHYLVNSQPLDSPMDGMKYSLTNGKKTMSALMRRVTTSKEIKTRPNIISSSISSTSAKSADTLLLDEPFKVFLLLIQPKSKIFEIIQVFYSPSRTTVRNVLEMIPGNATEPALGMQEYIGLCRPKDGNHIDIDLMASCTRSDDDDKDCARITRGEMLVAIPTGFTGSLCAQISKPILDNPKVKKLMERSDPLAPKRRQKKKKKRRTIAIETVKIETVKEESESVGSIDSEDRARAEKRKEHERKEKDYRRKERHSVRRALKSAAMEAASSNAQVDTDTESKTSLESKTSAGDIPVEFWKSNNSLQSRSTYGRSDSLCDSTIGSGENMASDLDDSFEISLSSLNAGYSSLKRIPRKSARPRRSTRLQNRKKQARAVALVLGAMLLRYLMVRRGIYQVTGFDDLFGIFGVLQVVVAFTAFCKLQRYLQGGNIQNCPFVQFLNTAWDRFDSSWIKSD